ncbi:hypothetical protein BOTBODRAFT_109632 [Botryobasidium botryosum FD-172 SS1]|uniref:Peroxisome assembly protein 12 n=1 Tax=Botryobasidium botryosum (strain FD-172 SS1) TaxID=930990 RepID=A0A067MG21_BOTB1|nr:hypothetical protein BOTBODRAFT_109632 [Botryobasidium botryosum FD-172 SS1]
MEFFNDVAGGDPHRPSLFELVAQEQLRDLLQPALKYVLSVFAQSYPRYLLRVVNKHEEFYALMMFFVERYYLREHNASFAENFYGLKRRRTPLIHTERANAATGIDIELEKLRPRDIRRSLLLLVGVPYLRAKAHDYYEQLGGGADTNDTTAPRADSVRFHPHSLASATGITLLTIAGRLRRSFKQLYPYANSAYELWLLAYNVAYLFDKTNFYRPWLSWIEVDLRRLGPEDYVQPLKATQTLLALLKTRGIIAFTRRALLSAPRLLLQSLKYLLPMSIFFVKFLEWWYAPSSPARSLVTPPTGPAIPPPKLIPPHPKGLKISGRAYGECPICGSPIANATALPSGYVFCYRCAWAYVDEHGKCPVTFTRVGLWQLRKVLI